MPLANPWGRKKAPVDWWDGSEYSRDRFETVMVGKLPGNPSFRLTCDFWHFHPVFNQSVEKMESIGIVWEQISEDLYAEPHLFKGCAWWRLVDRLSDDLRYDQCIGLHQGMENWDRMDTLVIHPRERWIPRESVAYATRMEERVIRRWTEIGACPHPGDPEYYERAGRGRIPDMANPRERIKLSVDWLAMKQATPSVTVEVQNNNPRTPPEEQLEYEEVALQACVEMLIE